MKRTTLFVFVLLIGTLHLVAQTVNSEHYLLSLSKAKFKWMVTKNIDSLKSLLDERLQYVHSNGWIQSKQEVLDDLKSGKLVYREVEVEKATVRMYGQTAVVVGKGRFAGEVSKTPFNMELMYTEVYVQKEPGWRLVSRHANKMPPQP